MAFNLPNSPKFPHARILHYTVIDVTSILSKRSDLPTGITIKLDMSKEEQHIEATLLKERWLLIQPGVNKRVIPTWEETC